MIVLAFPPPLKPFQPLRPKPTPKPSDGVIVERAITEPAVSLAAIMATAQEREKKNDKGAKKPSVQSGTLKPGDSIKFD